MPLFHISQKQEWIKSFDLKSYGKYLVDKNGFIHCCEFSQILNVANKNLKSIEDDFVVLCIDADRLTSEVKYEKNKDNTYSYHVYEPINKESVIDVIDLRKDKFGNFFISNELMNFSHYEKSCGAIVFKGLDEECKILLIGFMHEDELRWGFPKGHVENGETETETAIREIKEETGLDVKIIPEFRSSTHFSIKPGTINEAVYYCAEAISNKTIPQIGEVEKIKWFNFKEAHDHLTYDCDKKILINFIKYLHTKTIKQSSSGQALKAFL